MKKVFMSLGMAMLIITAAEAQTKAPAKPATPVLKNAKDSTGYAIGINVAENLIVQGLDKDINPEMIKKAIQDRLANRKTELDNQQAMNTLQEKLQAAAQKKIQAEKDKGAAYLAANKKRTGVTELPNGCLLYTSPSPRD